jgi:hypothetical protein
VNTFLTTLLVVTLLAITWFAVYAVVRLYRDEA